MTEQIKKKLLAYAPALADEYADAVRRQFTAMVHDLGPNLEGVYRSHKWHNAFNNISRNFDGKVVGLGTKIEYTLSEEKLKRNAKAYGESTALLWYGKVMDKIGPLTKVTVSRPDRSGNCYIKGNLGQDVVELRQQIIINYTKYGDPYHQFPALIYVNEKHFSEADYKKKLKKMNIAVKEKPVTLYKCGSCNHEGRMGEFKTYGRYGLWCPKCKSGNVYKVPGTGPQKKPDIDPLSRPKKYHFNFKITKSGGNFSGQAFSEHDEAKGMTEEEAWNKVKRWHDKYSKDMGWKPPVYSDIEVVTIYAWNSRLLWSKKSGETRPKELV